MMQQERPIGVRVVAEALTWLGTPYRHQGRRRGVGCDCLGLIVGIWDALYGGAPVPVPDTYSPDWAEAGAGDPLVEAAATHFRRCDNPIAAGTLILFRWRDGSPAKHCAVALSDHRMIHAYERHGVLVSPLGSHWRKRIAGTFAFPPIC